MDCLYAAFVQFAMGSKSKIQIHIYWWTPMDELHGANNISWSAQYLPFFAQNLKYSDYICQK